jgi:nitroreductase
VATHLTLAAADEGVDSCWLNLFDPDAVREGLGLPENEQVIALFDLGYGTEDAKPLSNHTKRKPLEETVTFL